MTVNEVAGLAYLAEVLDENSPQEDHSVQLHLSLVVMILEFVH